MHRYRGPNSIPMVFLLAPLCVVAIFSFLPNRAPAVDNRRKEEHPLDDSFLSRLFLNLRTDEGRINRFLAAQNGNNIVGGDPAHFLSRLLGRRSNVR